MNRIDDDKMNTTRNLDPWHVPEDIRAAVQDLVPKFPEDPGSDWRGCIVFYAQRAMQQERESAASRLSELERKVAEARKAAFIEAAVFAKNWLEDWGSELQGTCDAYREALTSGKFSGRKIAPDQAKTYARQFSERSDAVYACGELLAADLRKKAEGAQE